MNDRALRVLEKYELDVTSTRRGRGAWILETSQGLRILSEYSGSENRALFQNCVMRQLREGDYANVDVIVPNQEGALVSRDWEGNRYVVKEWYAGRECDPSNENEIFAAVQNLARLHRLMILKADTAMGERLEETAVRPEEDGKKTDACPKVGMIEDAMCTKDDLEDDGTCPKSDLTVNVTCQNNGQPEEPICLKEDLAGNDICLKDDLAENGIGLDDDRSRRDMNKEKEINFRENFTARPPLAEVQAWNAQLRRIRAFIRRRPEKSLFEQRFLDCYERYYAQAKETEARLEQAGDGLEKLRGEQADAVCHGDYSHHHVLMCGREIATTNFDSCRFDFQVNDLYRFMRKVLEKHDWNARLGMRMLEAYERVRPLPDAERQLLSARMLYPEKFRKLAGCYYGGNKAWISRQYMEKLDRMNRQETTRMEFLKIS